MSEITFIAYGNDEAELDAAANAIASDYFTDGVRYQLSIRAEPSAYFVSGQPVMPWRGECYAVANTPPPPPAPPNNGRTIFRGAT